MPSTGIRHGRIQRPIAYVRRISAHLPKQLLNRARFEPGLLSVRLKPRRHPPRSNSCKGSHMIDLSQVPDADGLNVVVSPDGKWIAFDFIVGDKHAVITMHSRRLPDAITAMLAALLNPALSSIFGPDIHEKRVYSALPIPASQIGTSVTPFGDTITADFELPGAVQLRIALSPSDAMRLREVLTDAINQCSERENLTKQ
ncbi:MAG: hypothetical protein QOK29_4472 [Rhodospirillaceae bacterium]|nr:hypothetical protein [Rhodospirillaceae bacterium]